MDLVGGREQGTAAAADFCPCARKKMRRRRQDWDGRKRMSSALVRSSFYGEGAGAGSPLPNLSALFQAHDPQDGRFASPPPRSAFNARRGCAVKAIITAVTLCHVCLCIVLGLAQQRLARVYGPGPGAPVGV